MAVGAVKGPLAALLLLVACAVPQYDPRVGWLVDGQITGKAIDSTGGRWQRYAVVEEWSPPYYLLYGRNGYACRVSGLEWDSIEIGRMYTCRWYLPVR